MQQQKLSYQGDSSALVGMTSKGFALLQNCHPERCQRQQPKPSYQEDSSALVGMTSKGFVLIQINRLLK